MAYKVKGPAIKEKAYEKQNRAMRAKHKKETGKDFRFYYKLLVLVSVEFLLLAGLLEWLAL